MRFKVVVRESVLMQIGEYLMWVSGFKVSDSLDFSYSLGEPVPQNCFVSISVRVSVRARGHSW